MNVKLLFIKNLSIRELFIKNLSIIIAEKELFGITRRKRLELCGLKRKWLAISSQIPNNSTRNSLILKFLIILKVGNLSNVISHRS